MGYAVVRPVEGIGRVGRPVAAVIARRFTNQVIGGVPGDLVPVVGLAVVETKQVILFCADIGVTVPLPGRTRPDPTSCVSIRMI